MNGEVRAPSRVIDVELAGRGSSSYQVVVGSGVLAELGERARAATVVGDRFGSRAALVYDAALPVETVERATDSLAAAGFAVTRAGAVADEETKTLDGLAPVLAALAGAKLERDEPVVALGGGVVGDLAGFAAAVYRRGVPVVQCPTTLLAMVDASIGGKTGVNLRGPDGTLRKNMAGCFHQPALVLADVETLRSLPARELRGGLAECVKHALIGGVWEDPELLAFTRAAVAGVGATAAGASDPSGLVELVTRNAELKARVVRTDEREEHGSGARATLNLGHTFGHALEVTPGLNAAPGLPGLSHGEAVGLGLIASARCARTLGLVGEQTVELVRGMVAATGLPTKVHGDFDPGAVAAVMKDDKKARGGRVRLVLLVSDDRILGTKLRAELVGDVPESAAVEALRGLA
jgi:3-dehydroquinate synthase